MQQKDIKKYTGTWFRGWKARSEEQKAIMRDTRRLAKRPSADAPAHEKPDEEAELSGKLLYYIFKNHLIKLFGRKLKYLN